MTFPTDYDSILERVSKINPVKYAQTRNYLDGDVTYLSPYLSRGVISLTQVMEEVLSKYSFEESEKFIQELAWREYYQRVWQNKNEDILRDMKHAQSDVCNQLIPIYLKSFSESTGITALDEGIRLLKKSGYMHNHMRMYVAMLVCNMHQFYWEKPSRWMYYYLLDADIASNTLSWQWVAGSFSSKKYIANQDNINKYTKSDQKNTFIDVSYDELASIKEGKGVYQIKFEAKTSLPNSKLLSINEELPILIYNSYNLDPNWMKEEHCNRVLLLEPSFYEAFPVSDMVIDFILKLSSNISNIQIFTGEFDELKMKFPSSDFVFKEHPINKNYEGRKLSREWLFPEVTDYYPSFFSYWKKCKKSIGIK